MHNTNWDDLRFVLAVADTGSVSSAARLMGVNHATVLRRVQAFEDRNGGPLFERTAQGYTLRPDRLRVIEAAREVENAVHSVERLMHGARAPLRGVVRVSSTDSLCQTLLPPLAAQMNAQSAQLRIELLSSNGHLDFSRLQADISVRPAKALSDDMRGERATGLRFMVYAAPDAPPTWLGLAGPLSRSAPADWLAAAIAPEDITGASDSFVVLRDMAAAGMGRAVLPCLLGDPDPRLARQEAGLPEMVVPIWVASQIDLADVPRLRAVRARITAHLAAHESLLLGLG